MNPYHHEAVNLAVQSTGPIWIEAKELPVMPSVKAGQNIFQVKVALPNNLLALSALDLQILAEGIVLDQDLLAECRCGEI